MKKVTILLFILFTTLTACTSDDEKTEEEVIKKDSSYSQNDTVNYRQTNQIKGKQDSSKTAQFTKKDSSKEDKPTEKKLTQPLTTLSPQQKLLKSIPEGIKVEFAAPDFSIIQDDTLILAKSGTFEINYLTQSLNDSLIAQEMYDYGGTNAKSYLISHNYITNIAMRKNGKLVGAKSVQKQMFKGKVDADFLEKSIIKHPEFVRFDEEKNEAIFKFMMGVPNTDWLVFAAINLNDKGTLRIIEILIPDL